MRSLWFVMPAHGRQRLTRVCLHELARVCQELGNHGVHATAVIVADDENLDAAAELGFWGVEQSNEQLGRKWNDGYQLACEHNADFVVPFGSDNWIDPDWIVAAPLDDTVIRCARECAVVNETGDRIGWFRSPFEGGIGIRIIPAWIVRELDGRPCVEDRNEIIDGSTLNRMKRTLGHRVQLDYLDLDATQIVDWKSAGNQIHPWASMINLDEDDRSPFEALAGVYPAEALNAMRDVYQAVTA